MEIEKEVRDAITDVPDEQTIIVPENNLETYDLEEILDSKFGIIRDENNNIINSSIQNTENTENTSIQEEEKVIEETETITLEENFEELLLNTDNETEDIEVLSENVINSLIDSSKQEEEEEKEEEGEEMDNTNIQINTITTQTRFSGADWFEEIKKRRILVGGAGGIGSHLIFMLSRLNPEYITVYDPDVFNFENLSGQLCTIENIGISKVHAIRGICNSFSNYYITSVKEPYTKESKDIYPIMISGFDNMEARRVFFENWKEKYENNKEALLIDGRLNAEQWEIFAIAGDDKNKMKEYEEKYLFDDEEAFSEVCSYKQTTMYASMIASFMTSILVNFCNNINKENFPRPVPFYTSFNGISFKFEADYEL